MSFVTVCNSPVDRKLNFRLETWLRVLAYLAQEQKSVCYVVDTVISNIVA